MTTNTLKTYPETTTFRWESATYTRAQATALFRDLRKQGGSAARRAAFAAAADTLDEIADDKMIDEFTGKQMKKVLIAAAHDHAWWGRNMTRFKLPEATAPDTKACFRCKETKPLDEFKTDPTPGQIKKYGMRPDTMRKVLTHVCAKCRKAKADAKRLSYTRKPRKVRDPANPEFAERINAFNLVKRQIMAHSNRVDSAIHRARREFIVRDEATGEIETHTTHEFRDAATEEYYKTKQDLLAICKRRLAELLGETTPMPTKWSQLLSKEEAHQLQTLHNQAFINDRKPPALW